MPIDMRAALYAITVVALIVLPTPMAVGRRRAVQVPAVALIAERSFVVTDKDILQPFLFHRVLQSLTSKSGADDQTPEQLFRQWLDTQNRRPGLAEPRGPHCDDFEIDGKPSFNGFPRRCPTPEGSLAAAPYLHDEYFPIALTNRFDLAPSDGSSCGQYRLIFARKTRTPDRFHIIFEAVLPNPQPTWGIAGCRPIAQFWADLSAIDSAVTRRDLLESFYFNGLPGSVPVIAPENLGTNGGGIRTLQIAHGKTRFYQFRVTKECIRAEACTVRIVPDVLENMPFGPLFNCNDMSSRARAFREEFVAQVPNLALRDVNKYFMRISTEFLLTEDNPVDPIPAFNYALSFLSGAKTVEGVAFRRRILDELALIGSRLTPEQILERAETQNCAGCHDKSGPVGEEVIFPQSLGGGQHVTEDGLPGDTQFKISLAMRQVFLPHRIRITSDFLAGKPEARAATLGGERAVQ